MASAGTGRKRQTDSGPVTQTTQRQIVIVIYAKARAKQPATRSGDRFYTPPETREFQAVVATATYLAMADQKVRKIAAKKQVTIDIEVTFAIPPSVTDRVIGQMHLQDPDCDNIAKMLCDGMQGVLYPNDNCVVPLYVDKRWGEKDMIQITARWVE